MEKNRLELEQQGFNTYENDAILVVFEESKQQAAAYDGDKMIGECQYNVAGTTKWVIAHTGVRPAYNGRGIAIGAVWGATMMWIDQ